MTHRTARSRWLAGCLLAVAFSSPKAEIAFEDVTGKAGIHHLGPTYGASWGDFDGDGWPDIWIGNHLIDNNKPVLYLNQRDGSFRDVSDAVVSVDPRTDLHGAAWGDFDNDGDQDLLATAGGGGGLDEAEGSNDNHLFVNDGGRLTDQAARLGVLDPQGRGRSALWFDADRDGLLDVLFLNYPRPDGKAPPAVYRQTATGFVSDNDLLDFVHRPLSRREKVMDLLDNVLHLRPRHRRARLGANEFAQLARLDGQGSPSLLAYLGPLRVFSVDAVPFTDVTNRLTMPDYDNVQDVAVEDFDGDGREDFFLARAVPSTSWSHGSDVVQTGERELKGRMVRAGQAQEPVAVHLHSEGAITVGFYPPWINPVIPDDRKPGLVIGSQRHAVSGPVTVSVWPEDPRLVAAMPLPQLPQNALTIQRDPQTATWTIASTIQRVNFTVWSEAPLDGVAPVGFTPSKGALPDVLLLQKAPLTFSEAPALPADACHSVAAGDFDNDMDLDLYLVCTGPVENLPNILLENQGGGRFVPTAGAGGAAGSLKGRGDAVVTADYDRDGFLDLFVTNGGDLAPFSDQGPYELFRNKGNGNRWLEIDLQGARSNRDGIGAVVEIEAGGVRQVRTQGGGMHHHAQNDKRLHFGLKDLGTVDAIKIRWPSGKQQVLRQVPAGQVLTVKEPADS